LKSAFIQAVLFRAAKPVYMPVLTAFFIQRNVEVIFIGRSFLIGTALCKSFHFIAIVIVTSLFELFAFGILGFQSPCVCPVNLPK